MMSVKIDKKDLKSNQFKKEWSTIKLKDICEKGKEKNKNTTIDIVFSNSALNGIVEQSSFFYKDIANRENLSTYFIVNKDDFVYNPRISSLAPCGPINRNKSGKKGVVSPLYTVFNLKNNKCELDYLEHYFKSSCWYKYMYSIANYGARSDRMNVTDSDFFNMELSLPPIEEQQKIASILSTWDKAIELKEKLIEQKKEQKKGLMQKLLTGEVRLPGFDGEWKNGTIKDLGLLKGGSGFPERYQNEVSGEYPFFKVSDMNKLENDKYMMSANNYISQIIRKEIKATIIPKESIIFAKVGAALLLERKRILTNDSCIDNNMMALTTYDNIDNIFVYYLLLNTKLSKVSNVGALPSLNAKDIYSIKCKYPADNSEQKAIGKLLTLVDKEIELLEKELLEKKYQKRGLMQQLLTGKTRVKV